MTPPYPFDGLRPHVESHVRAALERTGLDAWMPEGDGKWSLPLQFIPGGGWVELMRLAPGTVLPLHRHHGEAHGLNLQGQRRLDDGRVIGPGEYVFEPAGNVDSWQATGNEPLVLHVVVRGDVDYMAANGAVLRRITTPDRLASYRAFCAVRGLKPQLA
ncbi:cupin domain-containing protein [Roseateles cellulosilyticus]|uniref:Cupin domain-containing protein n=1 Tax=Pelomonas cellulosilytica TaxID=2906762 RepID=A0ABS8XXB5_9BURK|nr:cupin domain-containing protein [Pelomonas sp. P8]MCE4556447.1 cupin domain-containing protein [Pelomonas sp. P8]